MNPKIKSNLLVASFFLPKKHQPMALHLDFSWVKSPTVDEQSQAATSSNHDILVSNFAAHC